MKPAAKFTIHELRFRQNQTSQRFADQSSLASKKSKLLFSILVANFSRYSAISRGFVGSVEMITSHGKIILTQHRIPAPDISNIT